MSKVAFVFPGQGSQYVGMGEELANESQEVMNLYHTADKTLGLSLSKLCFLGPEEQLKQTEYTQPALLATNMACFTYFKNAGIKPDYVAGHSLGEYAAHVTAKSITFEEALKLVRARGQYMTECYPKGQGTMAAILGLEDQVVEDICQSVSTREKVVEPANFNCPGQIIIAGDKEAVEIVVENAIERGAKRTIILPVSGPFHSSLMQPAGTRISDNLKEINISDLKVPLMTNADAMLISKKEDVAESLIRQVSSPVRWTDSINKLLELGVDTFVEIGPGKVLSGLIKKINRKAIVVNIEDIKSSKKSIVKLKGCN